MIEAISAPSSLPPKPNTDQKLRDLSQELEATFLAEMLKTAGLGKARDSFGGGVGEDQFSSFLLQNQAKALVQNGGIGLAEQIFQSLKASSNV